MKKPSTPRRLAVLSSLFALCAAGILPAAAQQWNAVILPASLNQDRTIKLVGGHTQLLTFTLQADDAVTSRAKSHKIALEFDVPTGLDIVHQAGHFKLTESERKVADRRTVIRYDAEVENTSIIGKPGGRVATEWRVHSFFVNTPQSIPAGQNYVAVRVIDGTQNQSFTWPLSVEKLAQTARRTNRTPIGLWSYNYQRATNEAASQGIAQFFHDSGITYVQAAADEIYRKALQAQKITTGGNTHHALFNSNAHPAIDAAGTSHKGGFPDSQGILDLPADAEIPGVSHLIKNAREGDGLATYDYEPKGTIGFSEASIKVFKEKYSVSDADFQTFRDYVAKNGLQTHLSTNPLISKLWAQWTELSSYQTSNYVRRIYESVKAKAPEVKIVVTPSRSYGHGTTSSLALGTDNAAMAQYTDIILPQIYCGYGGANAKLAMNMTAGWRGEITRQNAKTQLWPLLLVRYAGAAPYNSAQRLYQQSIGAMAHGADGIAYYYPGNMDAPYWSMVSQLTHALGKYENYYLDGQRVDERFKLSQLPRGKTEVNMYPGYPEPVENPGWAFTAHELGNKVLLTLINLEEANDLVFGIDVGDVKYVSGENVEAISGKLSNILEEQIVPLTGVNQWLVGPGQVGFIVLEKN